LIQLSSALTRARLAHKKEGEQSLGRSRGGFSTKIHLATDALGNAVRFILTGGERNDITQAESLVEDLAAEHVIADKGYDSEAFVLKLEERGSQAVIPSRTNHKVQREIDTHLYKGRHLIENQIGKLKHFRRVFSRFDKLAKNYLSFIHFASTVIWLR
jgi:transposase